MRHATTRSSTAITTLSRAHRRLSTFSGASAARLRIRTARCDDNEHYVWLTAEPPEPSARSPNNIAIIIDKSGSMGNAATVMPDGGDDGGETYGLSLLDIVKHATSTVAMTLGHGDHLSMVSFDSSARVESGLTPMHEDGKERARVVAASLQPGSTTNLWDGLATGLDTLRDGGSTDAHTALMILTDGVPNVVPPRGHEDMLQRYLDTHGCFASIHTFGFGYSLDSKLLASLSHIGGGAFAFIPDASFMGTAFVHALANALSTYASHTELKIEVMGGASVRAVASASQLEATSWGGRLPLGPMQYGQARDVLLRAKLPPGSSIRATLTEGSSGTVIASSSEVDATSDRVAPGSAEALRLDEEVCWSSWSTPDQLASRHCTRNKRRELCPRFESLMAGASA